MSATDAFSAARTRIYDTVRWTASTLSGVAGVVTAGVALTGFPSLDGPGFCTAVIAGIIALASVLWGLGAMLVVLLHPPLYFTDIGKRRWLKTRIDNAGSNLFPAEVADFDSFMALQTARRADVKTSFDKLKPSITAGRNERSATYNAAVARHDELLDLRARITSFANLLVVRRLTQRCIIQVGLAAIIGFIALSVIAFQIGEANKRAEAVKQALEAKLPMPAPEPPGPLIGMLGTTCLCRLLAP